MDARTLVFGLLGVIVVGAGAILVNAFAVESTKTELRNARAQLQAAHLNVEDTQQSIDQTAERMRELRERETAARTLTDSVAGMESEIAKLTRLIDGAKGKFEAQHDMMKTAIQQVRDSYRNKPIPEIPLKLGAPLKDCNISGYKDDVVSFVHSTGTARLTSAQLPPDLADRLRVGWNPVLKISPESSAPPKAPEPEVATSVPDATPSPVDAPTEPQATTPRSKKAAELAALKAKTLAARQQMLEYERLSISATGPSSDKGLNAGKLGAKAMSTSEAKRAALDLYYQIQSAELQIRALEQEVAEMPFR